MRGKKALTRGPVILRSKTLGSRLRSSLPPFCSALPISFPHLLNPFHSPFLPSFVPNLISLSIAPLPLILPRLSSSLESRSPMESPTCSLQSSSLAHPVLDEWFRSRASHSSLPLLPSGPSFFSRLSSATLFPSLGNPGCSDLSGDAGGHIMPVKIAHTLNFDSGAVPANFKLNGHGSLRVFRARSRDS